MNMIMNIPSVPQECGQKVTTVSAPFTTPFTTMCNIKNVSGPYMLHLLDIFWLLVSVCINNAGWVD